MPADDKGRTNPSHFETLLVPGGHASNRKASPHSARTNEVMMVTTFAHPRGPGGPRKQWHRACIAQKGSLERKVDVPRRTRVLVVEDDPVSRRLLEVRLVSAGYEG